MAYFRALTSGGGGGSASGDFSHVKADTQTTKETITGTSGTATINYDGVLVGKVNFGFSGTSDKNLQLYITRDSVKHFICGWAINNGAYYNPNGTQYLYVGMDDEGIEVKAGDIISAEYKNTRPSSRVFDFTVYAKA